MDFSYWDSVKGRFLLCLYSPFTQKFWKNFFIMATAPLKYIVDNPEEYVSASTQKPEVAQRYQALIDANPYRNVEYRMSPWQKMLSKLGFRTGADAWKENMSVQANEYDQAILQKAYDEDYNDSFSQAARMRAAGLNPDLDPSSVSSGEAAPLGEDPSTPMQSTGEEGVVMQVANGVMSAVSTALGMVGSIQGIFKNRLQNNLLGLQNDLQTITNEKEFASWASSYSPMMLPESAHPQGIQNFDWKSVALENARKFAGDNLPKNLQSKFIDFQQRYFDSAIGEGESYEAFKNRIQSTKGMYSEENTFYSELPSVMLPIYDELGAIAEQVYKIRQKSDIVSSEASIAGSQTEIAYQNELNGQLMAEAQNSENKVIKEENETLGVLREHVNNIVQHLKAVSQEGGIKGAFGSLALSVVAGLQLWLSTQGMPSISRSQSNGGSSWSNGSGSAFRSSDSFSIGW